MVYFFKIILSRDPGSYENCAAIFNTGSNLKLWLFVTHSYICVFLDMKIINWKNPDKGIECDFLIPISL